MLLLEERMCLLELLQLGDLASWPGGAFLAFPRSLPSRTSFLHFESMKG